MLKNLRDIKKGDIVWVNNLEYTPSWMPSKLKLYKHNYVGFGIVSYNHSSNFSILLNVSHMDVDIFSINKNKTKKWLGKNTSVTIFERKEICSIRKNKHTAKYVTIIGNIND
jgi:hypothetical protein